ncbi:MAG: ATP-binding protein [Lachnospiraceae bacterium]|nr:ATP-binding protein [Lachnospiraceae bacterium]
MTQVLGIGNQDFEKVRTNNIFYIDKTDFIRRWWESGDEVTLIARPRRFGKTLNMSMVEKFFSVGYAGRSDPFEGLSIWEEEKYRTLQGTYPVISLSFAKVKETSYSNARKMICQIIQNLYNEYDFLLASDRLNQNEKDFFRRISADMEDYIAADSLNALSNYLMKYYGKKVIILLDEYDTPMQEAYVNGYWEELTAFTRSLFHAAFKTNPYLERALMTGITRISRESFFSDLNNLEAVTSTSGKYADCFGFTEEEVFAALKEYGLSDRVQQVKEWYDGFTFGGRQDIYNPWSIINFLDKREVGAYWVNTSSNSMVGKLIREGSPEIKMTMESLLQGKTFHSTFDEQIVFHQLDQGDEAVWSLLLASGYLRTVHYEFNTIRRKAEFELKLTNLEVHVMFEQLIEGWFKGCGRVNYAFLHALMTDDVKAMNTYMNRVALQTFSYFDALSHPSEEEPERFYHGFVLGLVVELADRYVITSNRESGFGRYDVILEPRKRQDGSVADDGIIIEFKVQDDDEKDLADTVREALRQIEEKNYQADLEARGIPAKRIRRYGFAFCGKRVLIGSSLTSD